MSIAYLPQSSDPAFFWISLISLQDRDASVQVKHVMPIPPCPLLVKKWDYVLSQTQVCYTDSDGDTITVGRCSELVAAIQELDHEHRKCRFYFKAQREGKTSLQAFMDELNKVKIRYEVVAYL